MNTIKLAAQEAKNTAEALEILSQEEAAETINDALELITEWGHSHGEKFLKSISVLLTFGGPNTYIRYSGAGAFVEVNWAGDTHTTHISEGAAIVQELDSVWDLIESGAI